MSLSSVVGREPLVDAEISDAQRLIYHWSMSVD